MIPDKEKKHGGYRLGAGRKPKAGKTKSRRIPEDITNEDINLLTKYKKQNFPLYEMHLEEGVPSIMCKTQYKTHKPQDKLFINNIENHFMVKVLGHHLREEGILENDLLLIDQKKDFKHNNIVIVTASNGKAVLKKLVKEDSRIRLISDNDNCPDIEVDEGSIDRIWGVVTRVIRDYSDYSDLEVKNS